MRGCEGERISEKILVHFLIMQHFFHSCVAYPQFSFDLLHNGRITVAGRIYYPDFVLTIFENQQVLGRWILELDHLQHNPEYMAGGRYTQQKEQEREKHLLDFFAHQPGPTAFLRLNEHYFYNKEGLRYKEKGEGGRVVDLEARVKKVWENIRKVVKGEEDGGRHVFLL